MTTCWCVLLLFLSPHCSLFGVRLSENVLQKIPCSELPMETTSSEEHDPHSSVPLRTSQLRGSS